MMSFLYPSFLWLLLPLVLLFLKTDRKLKTTVHLLILVALTFALVRPVSKEGLKESQIHAKDIIIALDLSYSMRAEDISPSRYHFARKSIDALLDANPTDNIMLIAFTTNPLLLSPPTTDHALIKIALKSLNPEYILTKGTSLERLFRKLIAMQSQNKHLILITDGGEERELDKLASLLQQTGTKVHILALGTTRGTTIPDTEGTLLKDKEGNLVISRINPILEPLANSVNGTYLTADHSPEATANTLNKMLHSSLDAQQTLNKMQYRYHEWYQLPLAVALILFLLLHTRGYRYLVLLFALFGMQAEASWLDFVYLQKAYKSYETKAYHTAIAEAKSIKHPSLQSQLLLANSYYKTGEYKRAIELYSNIKTGSRKTKQMLYYNIANAYVQLQAYAKAKMYYTKTLQLGDDADAASNLALIALMQASKEPSLGIAHPKSQSDSSSRSENKASQNKHERQEDQPNTQSGGTGEPQDKSKEQEHKRNMSSHQEEQKHPLGSKLYELINKGYIRETQPW